MYVRPWSVIMLWLPVVLLSLAGSAVARDKKPTVHRSEFDFRVTDVQYFADSETVIAHSVPDRSFRISHDGGKEWSKPDGVPDEAVLSIMLHPYDNQRAYAIGPGERHWYTSDRGKSWDRFEIEDSMKPASYRPLKFHAGDKDKVIFNANSQRCLHPLCFYSSFYTLDHFQDAKSEGMKLLHDGTMNGCMFAREQKEFRVGDAEKDNDLVLCAVRKGPSLVGGVRERILMTRDYYRSDDGFEPQLDGSKTMEGAFEMAAIKGYLVVARRSSDLSALGLYVSDDAIQWDKTEFDLGHDIHDGAYTMLESTDYSIQVLVKTLGNVDGMGTILSSNSNGTYFRTNVKHVNRNEKGYVDFEAVQGIQGIYLVNTVVNFKEAHNPFATKRLESKITFDDGRNFQDLKLVDKDGKPTDERVHLHSVTEMSNSGRVYSSPAIGIVMGVGNTGESLKPYRDGNLYISDDAGRTWREARKEAHKYEFGDQGAVVVAIYDEGPAENFVYSLKHGRDDWEEVELEAKFHTDILTTEPDSTSLKFLMTGVEAHGSSTKFVAYFLDFEGLHERACGDDDFEDWVARTDKDGEPNCLMGHTQVYRRRKADADCFVDQEFKLPKPKEDNCPCTKLDFECEYNFRPEHDGECVKTTSLKSPQGKCESGDENEKFKQSKYRLIPHNTCDRSKGVKLDEEEVEFDCKATKPPSGPASGEIVSTAKEFPGRRFLQKVYLERDKFSTDDDNDETVLVLTDDREVYVSHNQGKDWKKADFKEQILYIVPHPYNKNMVFFPTTTGKLVYSSTSRAKHFDQFEPPAPPNKRPDIPTMNFHVTKDNWIIWVGEVRDHFESWYSQSRGRSWEPLAKYCRKCEFIKQAGWEGQDDLVFCEQYEGEDPSATLQLVSSDDWFGSTPKEHFRDIVAFATMSDFIIVANKDSDQQLKIDASTDGKTFADARFPKGFNVPHGTSYTLLDSSTKAVFLQVTVSNVPGFQYGRLMKSNSNGTSYVSLMGAVNQNADGFVDFEKMQGIAGIAMVNIVDNAEDSTGGGKLLKTFITHNDGANWAPITNVVDELSEDFPCKPGKDCTLHLHSYTERDDPHDTFASASALGLMIGVGNVGQHLDHGQEGDTFITRDAGIQWHRVKHGRHYWEYGDKGSIIVLVKEQGTTDTLSYSLDEGKTWTDYAFHDSPIDVSDLTTVPSDKSHSFIIWGRDSNGRLLTVSVNFDGVRNRKCELKPDDSAASDYYNWTPKHPEQENDCLFGRKLVLNRKRPEATCWNDLEVPDIQKTLSENCTCTRRDFECDYNFELSNDNTCELVSGLTSLDPQQVCRDDPSLIFYNERQGYRKIPMTTCQGGEVGRYLGAERPCPGHESEFADAQPGLRGFGLFVVAFVLPCVAAGAVGWWVWQRWTGGVGSGGHIRLGEPRLGSGGSSWDADRPWIKYPVAVAAGIVAVVAAVPLLLGAAWRQLSSRVGGNRRYTSRASFARGRGDYAMVDPVEDELLGEDEDAEEL